MKEAKGTLLMLGGVIVAIVVVGFVLNPQGFPIGLPSVGKTTQKTQETAKKVVKVNETEVAVTLANTSGKRSKGLSGVESLGENKGMLFVFDKENQSAPFWMKGMVIAIDIIWINDGKVSQITSNIQPPQPGTKDQDLQLYSPDDPYDYVLEVTAGFSQKKGINVGDTVDLSKAL